MLMLTMTATMMNMSSMPTHTAGESWFTLGWGGGRGPAGAPAAIAQQKPGTVSIPAMVRKRDMDA